MNSRRLCIGLFGFGTVGRGLYELLENTCHANVELRRVCVRNIAKHRDCEVDMTDNAYNRQNEKCNFEKRKVHFLVFSGHFGRVCLTAVQSSLKRCLIG